MKAKTKRTINVRYIDVFELFARSVPNAVSFEWNRSTNKVKVFFDGIHSNEYSCAQIVRDYISKHQDESTQIKISLRGGY